MYRWILVRDEQAEIRQMQATMGAGRLDGGPITIDTAENRKTISCPCCGQPIRVRHYVTRAGSAKYNEHDAMPPHSANPEAKPPRTKCPLSMLTVGPDGYVNESYRLPKGWDEIEPEKEG